jgi:nucleoside-diphosphate-sugar epimerase
VLFIRAPPYYENVRALASQSVAEQSTVFLPWGEDSTVIPLVGTQDVFRVAAALLANPVADPGVPSERAYTVVGETPAVREMVEALGRAIGRPTRYMAITDEQWANAVKERLGPHALDHHSHLWQTFRKGEQRYQTTDAIRMVTGRNPLTLEEFFREKAGGRWECSGGLKCYLKLSFGFHLVFGYVGWLLCFSVYLWPLLRTAKLALQWPDLA